jgi:tripartite-type tricarboxylate transporter receptor subunit TctC
MMETPMAPVPTLRRRAPNRRDVLLAASAVALPWAANGAETDNYPNRPIRIICGFTPGSIGDLFLRAIGTQLATQLGQSIVVDNKPGASQIISAELAANAAPDGYTLYMGTQGGLVLNPVVRKKLPYDPLGFTPITMLFVTPMYLYTSTSLQARTVPELIAQARAQPGKLTFASIGAVTASHVLGEMFKASAGVDLLHVPYKGGPEATNALVSGQVDLYFNGNNSMQQVKQGKARVIAAATLKRSEEMPELPTVVEAGLTGFELLPWFGLFGPPGTPRPLVDRLNREFTAQLKSPAMKEKATQMGVQIVTTTPEALIAQVKAEIPQMVQVMQKAGVTPE